MNTKKKIAVRKLLSGVLVLLGFTACDSDGPGNELCEYGTPSADYQVKGKVLDQTGKPIKGVQVVVKDLDAVFVKGEKDYVSDYDTVYTDVKGEFESDKAHTFSIGSQEVLFHDVDGEEIIISSITISALILCCVGQSGGSNGKVPNKKKRKLVYGSL